MGKTYKVWVEIEELDSKGDGGEIGILPDCIGCFGGRKAKAMALARMATIVRAYGINPEHSDSVAAVEKARAAYDKKLAKRLAGFCKRCGTLLKMNGKCRDKTCPFSDRLQSETFTEG